MSNINCTESDCVFMEDGKCMLNTVPRIASAQTAKPLPCPYFKADSGQTSIT